MLYMLNVCASGQRAPRLTAGGRSTGCIQVQGGELPQHVLSRLPARAAAMHCRRTAWSLCAASSQSTWTPTAACTSRWSEQTSSGAAGDHAVQWQLGLDCLVELLQAAYRCCGCNIRLLGRVWRQPFAAASLGWP